MATKGCLFGKSKNQKIEFFKSLEQFSTSDLLFFLEQYEDLLGEEKTEFKKWLKK
jgi:hypothetical protein